MPSVFFFLSYAAAAALALGIERGGFALLAPVILIFGLLPLLDEICPDDWSEAAIAEPRGAYDLPLRLFVPVQLVLLAFATRSAALWEGPRSLVLLALATGVVTGACGITIAHELMHRRKRGDRGLAEILMGSVGYGHFTTEHVFGHHRFVATRHDPATARFGETFYAFLPRTVALGMRSALRLEAERVRARGLQEWSLADGRLRWLILSTGFAMGAAVLGGWHGLFVWCGQAMVAVVLLELINYLEHYGLERTLDANGRAERVQIKHSWNSGRLISGLFLFRLTRHSEHHFDAARPYERLPPGREAPQLPAGYASMLLLALIPPLWFRIMNPRAEALRRAEA